MNDATKIEVTLRTGSLSQPVTVEQCRASGDVPSIYFRSLEARDAFVASCPKSLRVRAYALGSGRPHEGNTYGLVWIGDRGQAPAADIHIASTTTRHSNVNQNTGTVNEGGNARLAKFLSLIEKHCEVKSAL